MSSTAIAISTAQSSAAVAMAAEAERKACEGVIATFDAKGAAISAMQTYADCVDRLYPQYSAADLSMLRYALIACFIGGAIGVYKGYEEDGIGMSIGLFFVGFVGTGAALFVIGLLLMAAQFVLGIG